MVSVFFPATIFLARLIINGYLAILEIQKLSDYDQFLPDLLRILGLENFDANVVLKANDQDVVRHVHVGFLKALASSVYLSDRVQSLYSQNNDQRKDLT